MSIQVQVSQRGLDLSLFAGKIEEKLLPGLVRVAVEYGYALMIDRAPVKSGKLLGSIDKHVQGLTGSVGPSVPYAVYVEYGTAPHIIRPVFSKVLAFEVNGKMVFSSIVRHPGTKPNPFVRRTIEDVQEKIPELWSDILWKDLVAHVVY